MGFAQFDQWTANMIERLVLAAEGRNELLKQQNELLEKLIKQKEEKPSYPFRL